MKLSTISITAAYWLLFLGLALLLMYVSFGVKTANNKRIALVMKALELSEATLDKKHT